MATDDTDTEAGGQTDDTGDAAEDTEVETGGDEGGERQAAKPDAEDKPSRKARRADVVRQNAMARAAAERERDELRQRVSAAESAANEVRARLEERDRQSQTTDKSAQTKQRIQSLRDQARDQIVLASGLKGEAATAAWNRHQELMDQADDLRDEMRDEARWEKRRGEISSSMPNQALSEERQYIASKYPWVATNVEGRALADGRFAALVNGGRPPSRQTMEEAITYAAKMLRIGGGSAPGNASRNAYVGTGQRGGEEDGGGSNGGTMSADDVRNNLALKRMALSTYNTLEPEQAYAKFAKEIGSKAMRPD